MKKFLLVLAIGGFVACSDNAANTENAAGDTAAVESLDTSAMATPDTSASATVDTLGAATGTDTLRK